MVGDMPVIRISDGTIERLKEWAEPLQDTADSALAKALDAAEAARKRPGRKGPTTVARTTRGVRQSAASRDRLAQSEFRQPLLEILHEMGGSARVANLRPTMREKMMPTLLQGDLELVSSGDERWWNATCWERRSLVKEGYIRDDSPRGTWELSERGMAHLEKSISESPDPFVEHLLAMPDVGNDADFDRDRLGSRGFEF